MKKIFIFAVPAALAIAAACDKTGLTGQEENTVYREFSAVISDGASTKVTFGEPDGNQITAEFSIGDEIALYDGSVSHTVSVTNVSEGGATVAGELPEGFTPTSAYYPASAFSDGTLSVPAVQTYGSVPVLLDGTVDNDHNSIAFSAADAGSAVVCYSLTGDIAVKEAYLYYKDKASFWFNDNVLMGPDYTLKFDTPLQLSSEAQKIYFVVPAGTKVLTLEIKTDAPKSAYGVSDYSYYRRKTSAVELASGNVVELPAIDFTEADLNNRVLWKFGSGNGGDCGWTVSNNGSINGTAGQDYATVTMGIQTATTQAGYTVYRGDFVYNQDFEFAAGSYRLFAFKSTAPQLIAGNTSLLPSGATPGGKPTIKFDISGLGQWRNNQNKSMTLATSTENCEIWVYDMLVHFGSNPEHFAPTAEPFSSTGNFQFKIADLGLTADTAVAPTYDVYWMGFFNSIEEIEAYIAETEGSSAAE